MSTPLLVTAHLSSLLAGDPPHLDALLESAISLYHPKAEAGYKVDRNYPAPPPGVLPIPILRRHVGGWPVGCCSSPILPAANVETVEHVNKRIAVEHAGLLAESERKVVATGNSWTKSYRLPLRVRLVDRCCWFAVGGRREVLKLLQKSVHAIGKKIADGYGRVDRWEVAAAEGDTSWYAPSAAGIVLMRPLPIGDWLPKDLIGYRRDFGAPTPPYWHPDRYTEIVVPC